MGGVAMVPIVFLILVLPFAVFWGVQVADLMARRDCEFPAKHDKLAWALVVVFGSLLGAFVYYCCKPRSGSAIRKYHSLIEESVPRFGAMGEVQAEQATD